MRRRGFTGAALLAPFLARPARRAAAQPFPDRPIRLVVPGGPGSPTDVMARLMADALQPLLRQTVVVDLRASAGGIVAGAAVAAAPPDGHTLLYANTSILAVNPAVHRAMPYDPATAFAPIALVSNAPMILVVHPRVAAQDLAGLLALGRSRPGALNFATASGGTLPHLVYEMLRLETGLSATRVPYASGAHALASVLAGETDATNEVISIVRRQAEAGTLRPLAVLARERDPALPEVPAMAELGFPNLVATSWTGLVAPARTPPELVALLNARVNEALRQEGLRARMQALGVMPMGGTAEDFASWAAQQRRSYTQAAEASGARAD